MNENNKEQDTNNLISDIFMSHYVIFIDTTESEYFKGAIKITSLDKTGIKILKSNFKEELSVIVIPPTMDFLSVEKYLFNLKGRTGQFWGQLGLGYIGKTWTLI
jgi:hypothetical protein